MIRVQTFRLAPPIIDAHKVGDQWVAYGWDRQGR